MAFNTLSLTGFGGRQLSGILRKSRTLCGSGELFSLLSRGYNEGERIDFIEGRSHLTPPTSAPTDPSTTHHIPVMVDEVMGFLAQNDRRSVILDLTFGGGGHSRKLLEASPGIRLVCLDRDPIAYSLAKDLQKQYPQRVLPLLGRFR